MARLMAKQEKSELVKTFDTVRHAPEEVWVGGIRGHMSSTAEFTKSSWMKYFMRRDYVVMDCGIPVSIEKPGIHRTVYYDDEHRSPLDVDNEREKKEAWIAYNMHVSAPNNALNKYGEPVSLHGFRHSFVWDCKDEGILGVVHLMTRESRDPFYNRHTKIPMDEQEVIEYAAILDNLTEAYRRRLETYWKRYGHKVSSYGYWADR